MEVKMEMEKEHNWTDSEKLTTVAYNKDRKFVCVEYPAVVNNIDKALNTLGGSKNVSKTYLQTKERISCKWRPDDVFCKPAFGERFATTNLLMKVKMRRKKGDNSGKTCQFKVEVLGSVDTTYKFRGMADFQYLPIVRDNDAYTAIGDRIVLDNIVDRTEFLNRDVPLYLPPVIFSRFDLPDKDYLFRNRMDHRRENYDDPDTARPANLIGTVREKRTVYTIFIGFKDIIPQYPTEEAIKNLRLRYNDLEREEELEKLFEMRPIWSRLALNHYFKESKDKLKYLLPMKAFYYLTGPWRCLWVKFGYDPRKDPSAKIYQSVDYRKRQISPDNPIDIKLKRTNDIIKFTSLKRNNPNIAKITVSSMSENKPEDQPSSSIDKPEDEEPEHIYLPGRLPPCRQMYYQMCDIKSDVVQKLLHDSTADVLDDKDGWCAKGTLEKCREVMSELVLEELRKKGLIKPEVKRKKISRRRRAKADPDPEDEDSDMDDDYDDDLNEDDDNAGMEEDTDYPPGAEEDMTVMEDDINEMETEILDCV